MTSTPTHARTPPAIAPSRRVAYRLCLALAAFAFVASLILWFISYFAPISLRHRSIDGPHAVPEDPDGWNELHLATHGVTSLQGRLLLIRETYTSAAPPELDLLKQWAPERGWRTHVLSPVPTGPRWFMWDNSRHVVLGAGYSSLPAGGATSYVVHVPFWLIMTLSAIPIARELSPGRRRARRRAQGLCPSCGYSRTDLPPETPCPECGKLPAADPAPSRVSTL